MGVVLQPPPLLRPPAGPLPEPGPEALEPSSRPRPPRAAVLLPLLSPELALVDPDLGAAARALLHDPGGFQPALAPGASRHRAPLREAHLPVPELLVPELPVPELLVPELPVPEPAPRPVPLLLREPRPTPPAPDAAGAPPLPAHVPLALVPPVPAAPAPAAEAPRAASAGERRPAGTPRRLVATAGVIAAVAVGVVAGSSATRQQPAAAVEADSPSPPASATARPEQTQPKQARPGQAQPKPAQPEQAQPKQAQPEQAQPKQARPGQAQPKQAQPKQAQPKQAQPSRPPAVAAKVQTFAWAPAAGASGYEIQLFRGDERVLVARTREPRRAIKLEQGTYRWYVWPLRDGVRDADPVVQARLDVR